MKITLIAERIFDGEYFHQDVPVTVEDGHILAFDTVVGAKEIRQAGTLVPGFIDVQVNGGGGALFNANPSVDCIETIGRAHARFGTTGFLPTLITDDVSVMANAADAVAEALVKGSAGVLGVHFEGPHLSVPKKVCIHRALFAKSPMLNSPYFVVKIWGLKWSRLRLRMCRQR